LRTNRWTHTVFYLRYIGRVFNAGVKQLQSHAQQPCYEGMMSKLFSRKKIKLKTNAKTYLQIFSSSIYGVAESSSVKFPEKSTSKLLDEDGGDCNCFKTASKIFLSLSKAKMW
jgi:hypothetical protein